MPKKPSYEDLEKRIRELEKAESRRILAEEDLKATQKKVQANLEETRQQLFAIIDFFPDPFFVIDNKGRVVAWNKAMEDLTAVKADSIVGKGDYEYALPFYGERRPILVDLALSWNESYREKYLSIKRRADGVLVSESFHPGLKGGIYLSGTACVLRDNEGRPRWAIENLRDITSIRQKNEYLTVLHSLSIGMLSNTELSTLLQQIVDKAAELTSIEDVFLHMYESQSDELVVWAACGKYKDLIGLRINPKSGLAGKVWQDGKPTIINHYQDWSDRLNEARLDFVHSIIGVPLKMESELKGVIGLSNRSPEKEIDESLVPILEQFSAFAALAIHNANLVNKIIEEGNKRVSAEKEKLVMARKLSQAQRMESIGNLAGGIAHDFNNILSSVIGFTELALDDVEKDSMIEDNLQEVYTAGKRAKELVAQILAFARQSEEEMKPIQVDLIVKEVLQFIRSSVPTDIEINKNIDSDSLIMGNQTQVHQIMMNLCANASHAMEDDGGTLDVTLKDIVVDKSMSKKIDLKPGNYIKLSVSDTGTGISHDIIDSIFDPYFSTKDPGEGTGMGLAMVQGIIESYGGKITVDSVLTEGTTFTIYVPVTRKRKIQRQYEPEKLPTGTERILFVDDEAPIAKMGSQGLDRLGYQVTTRTSSVEALELFRSKPNEFDLVITDMTMPNMTGDKLTVELMKIRSDIPVVLCTGYNKKISDETASKIGIKAFVYKPVVKADLAKTVREVLDEAKG